MEHPAWQLLLQHPSFTSNQQLILTLLGTSAAVRAAVMRKCAGMVSISYSINSMEAANQFIHWLHQYHSMVKSMHISCNVSSVTAAHEISQWLQQHYLLLHSLHLKFGAYMSYTEQQTAADVVASAMQQALADRAVSGSRRPIAGYMQHSAPTGVIVGSTQATAAAAAPQVDRLRATATAVVQAPILQLQELGLVLPDLTEPAPPDADAASIATKFVQHVSINQLTKLQLQCSWGAYSGWDEGVIMARGHAIQQALAPLTALCSLSLERTCLTGGMPVLKKLTHLTELQLNSPRMPTVMGVASLQYLPASLVKLVIPTFFRIGLDMYDFDTPTVIDDPPIDLQHCTSLTHLTLGMMLQHDDYLATSLVELSIYGCKSVAPLMQLRQLRRLKMLYSSRDHDDLKILSKLNSCSNLTDISIVLRCSGPPRWEPVRALSALGQVTALRELQLGEMCRTCAPMQHFSSLSQLSKLKLSYLTWLGGSAAEQMQQCAISLECCPDLQELAFHKQHFGNPNRDVQSVASKFKKRGSCAAVREANCRLAEAISGLSKLHTLHVVDSQGIEGCLARLRATQLTGLTATAGSITNAATLLHIANSLKGLRSLDVSNNGSLVGQKQHGCVTVNTIRDVLTGLTHLNVSGTDLPTTDVTRPSTLDFMVPSAVPRLGTPWLQRAREFCVKMMCFGP